VRGGPGCEGGDAGGTERVVGKGRLLVFTSDLDNQWNRFPLHPSFVPFAIETARYLTRGRQPHTGVPTVNDGESNPAATSVDEFKNGITRTARADNAAPLTVAREVEDQQRWWQVGLLVMLAALAGEALVGRRAA